MHTKMLFKKIKFTNCGMKQSFWLEKWETEWNIKTQVCPYIAQSVCFKIMPTLSNNSSQISEETLLCILRNTDFVQPRWSYRGIML